MLSAATINHVLHPNYYNFTTFLSSDMIHSQENSPEEGDFRTFFGTVILFVFTACKVNNCLQSDPDTFHQSGYSRRTVYSTR